MLYAGRIGSAVLGIASPLVCLLFAAVGGEVPTGRALIGDSEIDAIRIAGWEAAYQADYQTAKEKFAELQRRLPSHPIGDLSMASIIWQEYLFRVRRLQANLYRRDSSFYAGAGRGSEGSDGDAIDPQVETAFQEQLARAMTKAQAMVDAAPENIEALYFLGSVYGIRSAYEASAQRKFWAAFRDGLRSVKLHQKVLDLKPEYYDAYLTIGVYHYAIGCVPQPFRFLATMAGFRGGKKKGITELETVVQKGTYNREDARALLVALYRFENEPEQSLRELKAFSARYPRNPLMKIEMAATLAQLRRPVESTAIFEALLKGPDLRLADLVQFQYGEALALERSYPQAAERFAAVEQAPSAEPVLVTQALLRAAQMYDLAGQRRQAIRYYQACLSRPSNEGFRKYVEKGLRQPFTGS